MKYKIVSDQYVKELETQVRRLIKKDWEPLGGIAVATTLQGMSKSRFPNSYNGSTEIWFYQAMVKKGVKQ